MWLTLDLLADTTVVGREHSKRIIRNSAGCEKLQFKSATYPKILQKIGRYHLVTFLLVAPLELVIMQLLRGKKYIYIYPPSSPVSVLVCLSPFSSSPLSSPPSPPRLHLHFVGLAQDCLLRLVTGETAPPMVGSRKNTYRGRLSRGRMLPSCAPRKYQRLNMMQLLRALKNENGMLIHLSFDGVLENSNGF